MTTKTLDSSISLSNQEISFDFKAEHNGIGCIESLKPEDRGTERQYWFTAKMLCEIFDYADPKTIRSRIVNLVDTGDLNEGKNFLSLNIPNLQGNGAVRTTLYDLTVFNKLAMTFIDNPRAVEMRKAFNDVLVKHETGSAQNPQFALPTTYIEALEALLKSEKEKLALQVERDEAIRTKHHFVAGRDAKVCGELGGLRAQNEALRKQIGDSKTYKAVTAITWLPDYFDLSNKGLYGSLAHKLKKLEAEMPPEFAHIDIPDPRYGKVKAYHVGVIERLHEMVQADESLMEKYRKVSSLTVEA